MKKQTKAYCPGNKSHPHGLLGYLLKKTIFFAFLILLGSTIQAQNSITVTGTVKDEKGAPVPNANVIVKGTKTGVVTNAKGAYSIQVPNQNSTLVISNAGFQSQEMVVGSKTNVNVDLAVAVSQMNEVIVVGYGTQKKIDITGAVSTVKGAALVKSPAMDMTNSMAGRVPGLVVIQTGGEPGSDGANVSIRGTNTLGNNNPLYVIDGIPDRDGGMGRLNPRDIESISVLKDASAAIYGARAANGAILITTKKGVSGKPKITYEFNQGWSQPARIPELSNASEYASIMNELPIYKSIPVAEWGAASAAIKQSGTYDSPTPNVSTLNANYSPDAVKKYADGSDPWGYPDTDWFGDAFNTWSPQSRQYLALSGGNENVKYFSSLGYLSQDAYYKNTATKYKQYNFTSNLNAKINQYISASLGIVVRREDRNYPTESAGSIFRMLMRGRPTEPEVWPNGKPGPDIENGQNPYVITTNATGYQANPKDFIQGTGSLYISQPWVKGLMLTLTGAIDKNSETNKIWQTPWTLYSWDKITYEADGVTPKLVGAIRSNFTDPRLSQGYASVLNKNLTAMLNYDTKIATDHSIGALVGVTKETFTGENFLAYRRNYISPAIDQLFAGGSLGQNTNGSAYERARLGYYGRLNYNYKEKYLAEFIFRYDGSYIFPEEDRFGFFPGVLLGWNISREDFFKVDWVNNLKLRASYGEMGNDQVFYNNQLQEYAYLSTYGFGQYPINGAVVTTLNETRLANPNFTWERAHNFNVGVDATLFNNKVDVTVDYFYNKRDNILIQKLGSTPASSGISSLLPPENLGRVDNTGFDFSVSYNTKFGRDFFFRTGINAGYAKNTVVFMDEIPGAPAYQHQEGKPINAYLVYQYDGVFKDEADIAKNTIDYSGVTGQLIPGDMKFKDVNADGKIDGDDKVRQDQNATPTFNFGVNFSMQYKNFDLSILFQGATGAQIRVYTESGDIGNYLKYSYDHRWTIDNPSSVDPRLASRGDTYYTGGSYGNNSYYLFNKNYFRLKNFELGYNLPANLLEKIKMSNLRVFFNGLNIFTIDKMKVYDPEAVAESGVYYPQARVLNLGLTLTF
jgi:TonB-linked SusC/RagA family outer membrane protein